MATTSKRRAVAEGRGDGNGNRTEAATVKLAGTPRSALARVRAGLSRMSQRPDLRFALSFAVLAGVLFSVYSFPYPDGSTLRRWMDSYLRLYAHLSGWVLRAFDHQVTVSGQDIAGRYPIRIIRGCDAVDAQILFASAILASNTHSWRWRIFGVVSGLLLITLANVARICSLYYVGSYIPTYFDFFHHEFWPLVLILLAAGSFVAWSRLAISREGTAHATS